MENNQIYRNLINSEAFPLLKIVLRDICRIHYLDKFSNKTLSKEELFILQKQYVAINDLEQLIKDRAGMQEKEDEDISL